MCIRDSSHDGFNAFQFRVGIYRLVCSNGLVVADEEFSDFKIRHKGYTFAELRDVVSSAVKSLPAKVEVLNQMKNRELSKDEKNKLALDAMILRAGIKLNTPEATKFDYDEETIEDINPATGEIIANIPRSKANDVEEAVHAAETARNSWSNLSLDERRGWLEKIANALESRSEDIAKLESLDTGKPIKLARAVDAARSVANFRFFAEFSKDYTEEKFEMDDATNHVIFKPVGIAGLITPWNLPLYLLSWKIAPAIAAGIAWALKKKKSKLKT